jgi:hypothetical protein
VFITVVTFRSALRIPSFSFLGSLVFTWSNLLGADTENVSRGITTSDWVNASCENGKIGTKHREAYDSLSLANGTETILILVRGVTGISR